MLNEANGHFNLTRKKGLPSLGFSEKETLSFPQIFLSLEKLRHKKTGQFCKTSIIEAIWHFAISRIEVLKNCSYFFMSVLLNSEREIRGNERIYFSESPGPSLALVFLYKREGRKKKSWKDLTCTNTAVYVCFRLS